MMGAKKVKDTEGYLSYSRHHLVDSIVNIYHIFTIARKRKLDKRPDCSPELLASHERWK